MQKTITVALLALLLAACAQRPHSVVAAAEREPIARHLNAMHTALKQAHASAEDAHGASSVAAVKHYVDEVYLAIWGQSSTLTAGQNAAYVPGWRARWQTTYARFDSAFSERYGTAPGAITDPAELGLIGRGRHVRRVLSAYATTSNHPYHDMISPLNNVIGWHRLDDGVTKAERQPRIDLTYKWDAEAAFWLSEADTGWVFAVAAQALNILKTDYQQDLDLTRTHTADLLKLIERCLTGLDHNGDGTIAATAMEGGFNILTRRAREGGLL